MIKEQAHPIITSVMLLAMIGIVDFPIASYCATPTAAPTSPAGTASKTFAYDITVPLVYNGQNVGSTVIPKGDPVEVISETATTLTIRHMGNTLTINKPGKAPVTPVASTPTTPKVTARPVNPPSITRDTINKPSTTPTPPAAKATATKPKFVAQPVKSVADTAANIEIARMREITKRKMPYPVMAFTVESDGSYDCNFCTHDTERFERIGTKLRVLATGTISSAPHRIWELDDSDTIEAKMAADPKFAGGIKAYHKMLIATRGFGENWIDVIIAQKTRVAVGPSIYTVPGGTPIKEALALIANRDPRMQTLVNAADNSPGLTSWKDAPANCEHVGIETIAKELLADPKSLTPTAVSLRDEVEKLGVKHLRQPDNRSCTVYSAYHLLSFYMKKGIIRPLTLEEFKAMNPSWIRTHTISNNELLQIVAKMEPGLKVRVREMPKFGSGQTSYHNAACNRIYQAFLQHELAAGRPAWIGVTNHQVLLVEYNPNGDAYKRLDGYGLYKGSQRLTALDSTGFGDKDHNYSPWLIEDASTAMTLEFKPAAAGK